MRKRNKGNPTILFVTVDKNGMPREHFNKKDARILGENQNTSETAGAGGARGRHTWAGQGHVGGVRGTQRPNPTHRLGSVPVEILADVSWGGTGPFHPMI